MLEMHEGLKLVQQELVDDSKDEVPTHALVPEPKQGDVKMTALVVQGRRLQCQTKVIQSSSVLTDLVGLVDCDQGDIPVPDFISLQIILDLIEIVEKGDTLQCSHLSPSSLHYLVDFLVAMDFLDCSEVKTAVEKLVRKHINSATWKVVFDFTKNIPGLFTTACDAVKYLGEKLVEKAQQTSMITIKQEALESKYDYLNFPAHFFKVMLQEPGMEQLELLRQWVERNAEKKLDIIWLVSSLPFENMSDAQSKRTLDEMGTWGLALSMEAMEEAVARVEGIGQEKQERNQRAEKKIIGQEKQEREEREQRAEEEREREFEGWILQMYLEELE